MKSIGALSVLGLLLTTAAAPAASVIHVVTRDSSKTVVATTEITRNGDTVTAKTTLRPKTGAGYQPMGSSGGYKPMGGSGGSYNPMGAR
ncbi:MAG: hypothetical protein WCG92_15500 [Hyphomicrobiales bacterium]|nr:hypothetical protein [Alphaproteobacteria bacterium]